jgi:hypothetical protein
MKHDYLILFGDAAFTLRREMPESWATPTVNITVKDSENNTLQAATPATITAATTISADATRGRRTITVAAGTWEPGDLLRIADSDDGGPEDVRVESFDSVTKIVTLEQRLEESHASGAAVSARWMTYSLDASSATNYPNLREGSILWDPNTDDQAIRNTFQVSTKTLLPGGLEETFRIVYPAEAADVTDGGWATLEGGAIDRLANYYEGRGRNIRALVSESAAEDLIMSQIAYMVAVGSGKVERSVQLENNLARAKSEFEVVRRWTDTDQDDTLEDAEDERSDQPWPNRRW